MRKVIVSNYVSLDGFIEGPNREIDWFVWDEEMAKYAIDLLESMDTILFGRVTYELMASYWPTATDQDPIITDAMNNLPKIVFSKTLEKAEWKNSRLVREVISGEILRMKQQPGKNMVIFGSASIVSTFTQLGLIDEYRLIVNPVVLGGGTPLFKGLNDKLNMKVIKTKRFNNGAVLLCYQPDKRDDSR
jgi:dihydrofolate reductase